LEERKVKEMMSNMNYIINPQLLIVLYPTGLLGFSLPFDFDIVVD
jgi:hypothetical protein